MKRINCLRCNTPMRFLGQEIFQLGDMNPIYGRFTMQGGLELVVFSCERCGKVEFFRPDPEGVYEEKEPEWGPEADDGIVGVSMDGMPQIRCPRCGHKHDFDYPRCPRCDHEY